MSSGPSASINKRTIDIEIIQKASISQGFTLRQMQWYELLVDESQKYAVEKPWSPKRTDWAF